MRTAKHLYIILIICVAKSQPVAYVSPGVSLSYNLSGSFVISPKISFGLYQHRAFYNLTFGASFSPQAQSYPHTFGEIQFGALTPPSSWRKLQLFYGGGVGMTVPSKKNEPITPRFTFFTGNMVFLNVNVLLLDTTQSEIGTEFVLPIPMSHQSIGSIGG